MLEISQPPPKHLLTLGQIGTLSRTAMICVDLRKTAMQLMRDNLARVDPAEPRIDL